MSRYNAAEIRALFERGENIMGWLRAQDGASVNSPTAILYSYDAQAGTYAAALREPAYRELKLSAGKRLAALLDELKPSSLLDAGTGEATTLVPTLQAMQRPPVEILGFDISLSRLLYARQELEAVSQQSTLFTAELDHIPLAESSVDIVLTFHAIEPNHGQEETILRELLRVARSHVVLVEPSYELGSAVTRERIERLGYVRGLPDTLTSIGYPPALVELFGIDANPANQAALIVVEKQAARQPQKIGFTSPISQRPLVRRPDCWFCPDDGHAFPVIGGIPCLTTDSAILASKLHA
jgi:SAM-dependent methyltransferase